MKIALDVGHTLNNVNGNSQYDYHEHTHMVVLSDKTKEYLDKITEVECRIFDYPAMTDGSAELRKVVEEINAWGADVVVSFHSNAASDTSARGLEIFSYSLTGNGYKLATFLQNSLWETMSKLDTGFKNRGVKQGSQFYLINSTNAPAALIEFGFHTNKEDIVLMTTYVDDIAKATAKGVLGYFGLELIDETWQEEFERVWQKAIDLGVTDGSDPNGYLTRNQFVVMLDRLGLLK